MAKKQKSGLYRTKIKIGVNPDGSSLTKWISARTQAELEDAKRTVRNFYIAGIGLRPDRVLGNYVVEWYHVRKEHRLSLSSQVSYKSLINKHLLPAFGNRNLRAITPMELQQWLNGFKGMSKTTITLALTILKGVFSAAKSDRIILDNPTTDLVRPESGKSETRRALTNDEIVKILELIDSLLLLPDRKMDALYLAVLFYLGVRPGEGRGLQWGDFDWNKNTVHIQRDIDFNRKGNLVGDLKTKAANRIIPVPEELRSILYPIRENADTFLLYGIRSNKPISSRASGVMWLRCMIDIGLATRREQPCKISDIRGQWEPLITPHYLRHNYITMCWEAGLDPLVTMRIVGHKDYRTTANVYTHLNEEHIQKTRVKIESVFTKKVAQKLHNRV